MSFNDIFKSSFLENVTAVSLPDMALALVLSFCLGLFIYLVYKKTYSGVMFSRTFGGSLVGMTMITTMVILVSFGAGPDGYTGAANQGVPILPWLAGKIHWLFEWLFGFKDMRLIAFPMTSLGSVGASLGLLPTFRDAGILDGNVIAVFTAIGMCWSGYLSTHTAMLDTLGYRKAISKALGAHTVAGLCAGVIAHFVYLLFSLL